MSTTFKARYRGVCKFTGATILPGDLIRMVGIDAVLVQRNPSSDRSDLIRLGGREFIRNARGRCEDAPCCGCCTI